MQRTFVIGDIHGCYDELIALTEKIGLRDDDVLISLGDIVDRGGKSKEVYEYFLNRPNSKVLIGNHERKHINDTMSYAQEIVKVQFGDDYTVFVDWLRTLDYYYETDDAIIVHAAFEHDKLLAEQKVEVLSGTTSGDRYLEKKYAPETYWNDYYQGEKPIIYGHHVVGDKPEIKNNTYGIDTACCHGGYLTAIELPGFIIHQVKAEKDYWTEERIKWQVPVLKSKDWMHMEIAAIRKQLQKLEYINALEIRRYLNALENAVNQFEEFLSTLKNEIEKLALEITVNHGNDFAKIASQYSFQSFLFKSKANNLTLENFARSINTPAKIIALAKELGLQDIPELPN